MIFLSTVIVYAIYKFENLKHFYDTNIKTSLQEHYFNSSYIIRGEKGQFQVAFGLVALDGSLDDGIQSMVKLRRD